MSKPLVAILMGSSSDMEIMNEAAKILTEFGVPSETKVLSAHRAPEQLGEYVKTTKSLKVFIAGAGGAAHLPGVVASMTTCPVIGVPIKSRNSIAGLDSLLSIVQMPSGVPVATVAVDGAKNAGILAAQILALSDETLAGKMNDFKVGLSKK